VATPTSARRPFRRQTIPEAIAEALRERILSGEIPGGLQLRQEAIAGEYSVSRIPVREALRQLEAEGLVKLQAHRGAVVTELSLAEIGELFEIRAQLERDILDRAIPHLAAGDFAEAESVLDTFDRAFATEDVTVWGELNWKFHGILYQPADRPHTLAIIHNLHINTDRYSRLQLLLTRGAARAQEEHRRILTLCHKRNRDAACKLLEQHIVNAGNMLVAFLAEHRTRGTMSAEVAAAKRGGAR
jgi:DNA-binding GntR family transcriptional regulator